VAFALKARLRVTFEPIEIVIDTAKRSERVAALQAKTDDDIATARADVDDFNTVPHDIVDEDMPWPNTTVVHNDNATQVSQ
jgi:hypothetical protein